MSALYIFIASKSTVDAVIPSVAVNQLDYNRRVAQAFRAQGGGRLTVGDLKLRPNSTAIPNHLLCDGSRVVRAQFPELFRFLGVTEGAGDGVSTFNLPNYLGTPLAVPASAPVQAVTDGGTSSTGAPITDPVGLGGIGGTDGGNVVSGGRVKDIITP